VLVSLKIETHTHTSATVKISNPTSCQEPYDPGKNPPFDEWSTSFPRIQYKKLLPRHSRALIYEASSVHTLISCRTRYPLPTETTSNSPVPARMPPTKPLHVAVLLIPPVQLLDASPVDLFGMLSKEYLLACKLPAPLTALGIDVVINYVCESGAGTLAQMTANAGLKITANLTDDVVKPGNVDILLIPGPDPSVLPSETVQVYIRSHVGKAEAIMMICTGIYPAAYSGTLKGKRATGPRALVPDLRKKFPDTQWVEKRWTKDGSIWCSGTFVTLC